MRVRVDWGGTTGVLDRGMTEQEEEEQERQRPCLALTQIHRHHNLLKQWDETNVYICIFRWMGLEPVGLWATSSDAYTYTHTHKNARWRLCRKHSGVPRSRGSLPKTCTERDYREDREEKSLVPVRHHFVLHKTRSLFQYLSLSFIAQGGRPLPPVTSCLFPVLSDRDTPRFSP